MLKMGMAGVSAAALLAFSPANATLLFAIDVDGVNVARYSDNCAASAACPGGDQNPAIGVLALAANESFGGVVVNGSVQTSTAGPVNILNSSSLQITSAVAHHVDAAVGDTGFIGPANSASASASGTVQTGAGSAFTYSFFNDPTNGQGAESPSDTPGTTLDTFMFTAVDSLADAFSHSSGAIPVSDPGAFSMTQRFTADLTAGVVLVGNSQTELKTQVPVVPEPSTLLILASAIGGLLFARRRRNEGGVAA